MENYLTMKKLNVQIVADVWDYNMFLYNSIYSLLGILSIH